MQYNISLKGLNSFGIEASARQFLEFSDVAPLVEFFSAPESQRGDWYLLSGGNNVLLRGDYQGTIIHPVSQEIEVLSSDNKRVIVQVGAGVEWDDFVQWAVDRNLGGVENLSLIPGYVGAAPVQNIGAYGAEAKDTILEVEIFMTESCEVIKMSHDECSFAYRDSIFKGVLRGKAIILSVTFGLLQAPQLRLDYGDLSSAVDLLGGATLANVRRAVVSIRESKLPDPKVLGNAGSFFKNPIVRRSCAEALKHKFPQVPIYEIDNEYVKVAAGWLIDRAGWRGFRRASVGVHDKQALVLVNHGGATGAEVVALARDICDDIKQKFEIEIDMEVNLL